MVKIISTGPSVCTASGLSSKMKMDPSAQPLSCLMLLPNEVSVDHVLSSIHSLVSRLESYSDNRFFVAQRRLSWSNH